MFNILSAPVVVSYPDRFLASIFILRRHREARKGLAHFLCWTSSTTATTDMQLIKHSRDVVSVWRAEKRTKPLRSHVGALATFSRRVPWQRKGRIKRLKQPESAEVAHISINQSINQSLFKCTVPISTRAQIGPLQHLHITGKMNTHEPAVVLPKPCMPHTYNDR